MALPRYRANNTPKPSGSANSTSVTPSPASAAGNSKTASSNKASQNSGAPVPGVLLGLSGGWLVARIFLFGGSLWLLEIIAMVAMAGFSHSKGGKVQKRVATAIIAVALLNLFVPGINPWIKSLRESQLHPPPPTEQSAGQEQVNPSPSPTPTPRATHRVIASGEVIVLDRNKAITIPEGRKSLCFSYLGIPGDKMVNQKVKIGEEIFSEMGTVCKDISHLSGNLPIVIFPDDNWSSQQVRDFYAYWRDQPGGQGEFPIIRIGE